MICERVAKRSTHESRMFSDLYACRPRFSNQVHRDINDVVQTGRISSLDHMTDDPRSVSNVEETLKHHRRLIYTFLKVFLLRRD